MKGIYFVSPAELLYTRILSPAHRSSLRGLGNSRGNLINIVFQVAGIQTIGWSMPEGHGVRDAGYA